MAAGGRALRRYPQWERQVFTGKGVMVTRGGERLPLIYEYVDTAENGRRDRLLCETENGPGLCAEDMHLKCEGIVMRVATRLLDRPLVLGSV